MDNLELIKILQTKLNTYQQALVKQQAQVIFTSGAIKEIESIVAMLQAESNPKPESTQREGVNPTQDTPESSPKPLLGVSKAKDA